MIENSKFYPAGKPNVLVTGGAGFIGSHLCEALVKDNNVICLDNLIAPLSYHNIEVLLQQPNFYFIKHDINEPIDPFSFKELDNLKIKFQGIREIYHLACPTSAKNFEKFKIETLKANSIGVLNVLELAKNFKAKILFTSSSVVYGPRDENPYFKESDLGKVNFTGPRSCYDEGKRFAETAFFTYHQVFGLESKVARIFRIYGPKLALFEGEMIADFVLQAINNLPLVIYGNESFDTSLCFISDLIDGLLLLMKSKEAGPINFGHPQKYRLAEVAEKIIEMTGSSSKIEFKEPLLFMTPLGLPDISLAKEKLNWFPVVSLEEGLKRTIEYVRANRLSLSPLLKKYESR